MHAMQESGNGHDHGSGANGFADGANSSVARNHKGPDMKDTLGTIVGMLLPLLTVFGHHH